MIDLSLKSLNDSKMDINGVTTSSTNGNIKINNVEKTIYTHPNTHASGMITGLSTVATSGAASDVTFSNANFTSTNVNAALNELFTNVSNGKTQIASAITDKGISASGSDTFTTLASKISQIKNVPSSVNCGIVKLQTITVDSSGGYAYNNINTGSLLVRTEHSNNGGGSIVSVLDSNCNLITTVSDIQGMSSPMKGGITDTNEFIMEYSPSSDEAIYVIDATTGKYKGSINQAGYTYTHGACMSLNGKYVGMVREDTNANVFFVISSWNGSSSSKIISIPHAMTTVGVYAMIMNNNGYCFYGGYDGTYKMFWFNTSGISGSSALNSYTRLITADSSYNVYLTTDSTLYKFSATGSLLWSKPKTSFTSDTASMSVLTAIGSYVYVSVGTKELKLDSNGTLVDFIDFSAINPSGSPVFPNATRTEFLARTSANQVSKYVIF